MISSPEPVARPRRGDTPSFPPAAGATLGALLGIAVGLWEAGVLYFRPRLSTLHAAEAGWSIWLIAPLTDALLLGVIGSLFSMAVSSIKSLRAHASALTLGFLSGLAGATASWSFSLSKEWVGNLTAYHDVSDPALGFLAGLAVGLGLARVAGPDSISTLQRRLPSRRTLLPGLTAAGLLLGLGAAARSTLLPVSSSADHPHPAATARPNIVLITLDAARADHFSSYGYHRPTTPHMDRLAARGVLFENAIAPSSWTLPSLASIMSGLLPHQHGADEGLPASPPFWNISEILRQRGYETAGFNGNTLYGQSAWGLGAGLDRYSDYSESLRYNLALTIAGRVVIQPAYEKLVRYDLFCRRSAGDLTDEALRWHRSQRGQPFFLFVHYFEPHDSYLPPAPYDRRFGRMSPELARRVSFGHGLVPERPFTSDEHRDIIAAYDNSLAYADEQIGRLLRAIEQSPERDNTYIILTSDHGEAFGEHGSYGHGWTLYREVLHVPLILAGPGIPSGLRVSRVARIREIFPTVMELALGERFPFNRTSLRRFWNPSFQPEGYDLGATSQLSSGFQQLAKPPLISLMTEEWHYLHRADGRSELYRWTTDPREQTDLSSRPEFRPLMNELHAQLSERMRHSMRPWFAPHYLLALDTPETSLLRELAFGFPPGAGPPGPRVGMSQAGFPPDTSEPPKRRVRTEEDLLRSLPYR